MTLVNKEVVQNKSVEELKDEGEFGNLFNTDYPVDYHAVNMIGVQSRYRRLPSRLKSLKNCSRSRSFDV